MSGSEAFNWIDGVVISVLLLGAMYGIKQGLFKSLCSVLLWVLGFIVAVWCTQSLTELLDEAQLPLQGWHYAISFIAVVLAVWAVGRVILVIMTLFGDHSEKTMASRGVGMLIGIGKGWVILAIFAAGLQSVHWVAQSGRWQQAESVPYLLQSAGTMEKLVSFEWEIDGNNRPYLYNG